MAEPDLVQAIRYLSEFVGVPNDARLRLEALLTGEPYQPRNAQPADPRDEENARLRAMLDLLMAERAQPQSAASPAPSESPDQPIDAGSLSGAGLVTTVPPSQELPAAPDTAGAADAKPKRKRKAG